jgi:uncharacterized repeat protein (TIGR01451 family)
VLTRRFLLLFTALITLAPAALAQSADLFVSKSGPATATVGSNVPFIVTITNNGPDPAATVQLTDPLPPGMTFFSGVQNNGPSFSCSYPPDGTNGTITCSIASLSTGTSATFTFIANITAPAPSGTQFVNTATGSSATPDPNSGNSFGTQTVTVTQTADLYVTKDGPTTAPAGSDVTFTITAGNNGPDSDSVSLTDTLPAGMTFVSITQTGGAASLPCPTQPPPGSGGTINCMGTFASGQTATLSLVVNIPADTAEGTTFTNQASVSGNAYDPDPDNNSQSAAVMVPIPEADMGVQKVGPSAAAPDSDVTYSITVYNNGPDAAVNATLTDTLPGTMTFVSIIQNSGPPFGCGFSAPTVTCTAASMPAGTTVFFTLTGHIPPGTASGTTYTNTAQISSDLSDPNPNNNSSLTFLTVVTSDLAITKTGPGTATSGGPISWTITASNNGPDISSPTVFDDALPAGTTFVSITQNTGPAFVCTGPGAGNNGNVECSIGTVGNFAPGASAQFTLTANITPTFVGNLSNTATISGPNADPNPNNNSATAVTTVSASADLTINKTGPASANAGTDITYTVTLTNSGPSNAANVSLTDAVPANTTFVSETQTAGPTFSCSTPAPGGTGTITCTIGSMPLTSATFSITVHINAGASGATITNTANVSSTTTDPNPSGNTPTVNTTVTRSADVAVLKTAPSAAIAGTTMTYNITVTNNGPSDAASVTMADTLPPNTTFVSETQPTGPAFICSNPSVGGTGTVSCSIAALTAGTTATFTITVQIALAAPIGPSSNTATVTSTSDPNSGNDSSTAVTQIAAALADLSITKAPTTAPPYGTGMPVTYTIVVTNSGPNPATSVTVTDVLPAGTTFQSSTPPGACSGTTTITCNAGTLANGATATFTITITLPPTAGPVVNTATVSASPLTPDPNLGNNTATSTITVIPASNIPAVSPLALLLLCIALAAAGAISQRH